MTQRQKVSDETILQFYLGQTKRLRAELGMMGIDEFGGPRMKAILKQIGFCSGITDRIHFKILAEWVCSPDQALRFAGYMGLAREFYKTRYDCDN